MTDDEVLVTGAVVFRTRGKKNSWLLVKVGQDGEWQFPKGVVRRAESSVRGAIRTVSELAGLRGKVLEEAGRSTATSGRNCRATARRTIYYLIQQRGKDGETPTAKVVWLDFARAKVKLQNATERRIFSQARKVLVAWQKDETKIH